MAKGKATKKTVSVSKKPKAKNSTWMVVVGITLLWASAAYWIIQNGEPRLITNALPAGISNTAAIDLLMPAYFPR